jgi:hypothetical protein
LGQRGRKPIEGDCAICQRSLELGIEELTFCKNCGNNLHSECTNDWKTTETRTKESATCPFCTKVWSFSWRDRVHTLTLNDVDPEGFKVYIEWIYKERILYDTGSQAEDGREGIVNFRPLVHAYHIGDRLEDQKFQDAILKAFMEIMEVHDCRPSLGIVYLAYKLSKNRFCKLRRLFIEICAIPGGSNRLQREGSGEFPPGQFLVDLCTEVTLKHSKGSNWMEPLNIDAMLEELGVWDVGEGGGEDINNGAWMASTLQCIEKMRQEYI